MQARGLHHNKRNHNPGNPPSRKPVATMTRAEIYRQILRELFAPLADLLFEDDSVTEVLINGPGTTYYEREGKLYLYDRPFGSGPPGDEPSGNVHALMTAVRNLAEYTNRRVDGDRHSMDARLPAPELFRVHVCRGSVSSADK